MKRTSTYHNPGRYGAILGAFALLLIAFPAAKAQSIIETSATSNGGDLHEGSYGEMYSTIGEPVASDSTSVARDETTWTGFWQVVPVGGVAGVHEDTNPAASTETMIAAVAPEPFTSNLDVRVALAHAAQVRLVLFDMLGRPVGSLIDGHREAGTLHVTWHPEGLDGGSYVLQLLVDGEARGSRLVHYYR